jgi:hypothetical protein
MNRKPRFTLTDVFWALFLVSIGASSMVYTDIIPSIKPLFLSTSIFAALGVLLVRTREGATIGVVAYLSFLATYFVILFVLGHLSI